MVDRGYSLNKNSHMHRKYTRDRMSTTIRFDDVNDEVEAKVRLFEEAGVAGGFETEELRGASGVEVAESVGEEREDVGVGAEGGGLGWRGCGGCVVVAVGCWQLCVVTVDCV
ncbi:uncharacterized protein LOC115994673 [Quercus lobata]|uniref:uncharacterized protein LOC115994673 n=1 Tax=Quercus lobata TaxID=97700 RepID=UPI0012492609|nr:uncharacterized protein LOC115994673 [Quercus lobata]